MINIDGSVSLVIRQEIVDVLKSDLDLVETKRHSDQFGTEYDTSLFDHLGEVGWRSSD